MSNEKELLQNELKKIIQNNDFGSDNKPRNKQGTQRPYKQRNKNYNQQDRWQSNYQKPNYQKPNYQKPLYQKKSNFKARNTYLLSSLNEIVWHQIFEDSFGEEYKNTKQMKLTQEEINKLQLHSRTLYESETENYHHKNEQGEDKWLSTVMSRGTFSDRLTAMGELIKKNPICNWKILESLILKTTGNIKRQAIPTTKILTEIFLEILPERKLKFFGGDHLQQLAMKFPNLTKSITKQSKNMKIDNSKKEEFEALLILIEFEDTLKTFYRQFIKSLESGVHDSLFVFKKQCIKTLFQFLIEKPEAESVLLSILVNKLGDNDRKICSQVAYYLSKITTRHPLMKPFIIQEVESIIFKPNISEKAQFFSLVYLNHIHLKEGDEGIATKLLNIYFSLFRKLINEKNLESKILGAILTGVNKVFPLAKEEKIYEENIDHLFKIVHKSPFNTSVQAIVLLSQISTKQSKYSDRFYRVLYESLYSSELSTSGQQTLYLNTLYKSLKNDESSERVAAFIKRLLQISFTKKASFVCGILFMISEIIKDLPKVKNMIKYPEPKISEEGQIYNRFGSDKYNDEENGFEIVREKPQFKKNKKQKRRKNKKELKKEMEEQFYYNSKKRNPLYSKAENTCLWELVTFANHYHPSVRAFTQRILDGKNIVYYGDPLVDFNFSSFLDGFLRKKPKISSNIISETEKFSLLKEEDIVKKLKGQIPENEFFIYKYFQSRDQKKFDKIKEKRKLQKNTKLNEKLLLQEQERLGTDDMDSIAAEVSLSSSSSSEPEQLELSNSDSEFSSDENENDNQEFDNDEFGFQNEQINDKQYLMKDTKSPFLPSTLFQNIVGDYEVNDDDEDDDDEEVDVDNTNKNDIYAFNMNDFDEDSEENNERKNKKKYKNNKKKRRKN
ncbi:ccaat-binding factor-related [Anaeramoeba flamelloides]|uniref:Ccaat-binding factor-related n=1 Tax=Anaeramoeba flamelloides TaxID=1746091 RepID=A0ABQ8XKG1_9EUKA|nr:ccaat-binding factor-related [Anaeramoeba flamelloides]